MLGRLVRKISEAQLPDPTQPLKLRRIHKRDNKAPLRGIRIDPDYIVYGIPVDPFRQTPFLLLETCLLCGVANC